MPKSIHDDPALAEKVYPCGEKTDALARCYCGAIEIVVRTENPISTGFCHCVGCRTAHSAPMYHILYCETGNLDCKTGLEKEGCHEIQIIKGIELLTVVSRGATVQRDVSKRGLGRLQCSLCGTRMLNALISSDDGKSRWGVFASTFTEKLKNFARSWQPRRHFNCESAILPLTAICDGLPKYLLGEDGPRIVE